MLNRAANIFMVLMLGALVLMGFATMMVCWPGNARASGVAPTAGVQGTPMIPNMGMPADPGLAVPIRPSLPPPTMQGAMFDQMDMNRDGTITKDEMRNFNDAFFDTMDKNRDARLSREEIMPAQPPLNGGVGGQPVLR